MTAHVTPTVLIANTPQALLDHLVERTADTVGKQVDRSQLVIVGRIEAIDARSERVRQEDAAVLGPWLSGEARAYPSIVIHVTRVKIEKILVGDSNEHVEIAYPGPRASADFFPNFNVHDRGLLFLRNIPPDAPYAPYISQPAYQLSPGEKGMRSFLVNDYDDKGRPVTRDETSKVQETIEAVQWYAALPHQDETKLQEQLLTALGHTNARAVHHAIRALARQGDPTIAGIFKDRLQGAAEELRVRLMLGLRILGEKEFAGKILEEFFHKHGKHAWLRRFGIESTVTDTGKEPDTLFGPDPSEIKGD